VNEGGRTGWNRSPGAITDVTAKMRRTAVVVDVVNVAW